MAPFIWCLSLLIFVALRASAATGRLPYTEISKEMTARHEQWMSEHGRTYRDAAEKELRLNIFKQNVEYIESFNGAAAAGGHKYKLGLNKFSDLTNEEFKATYSSGYMPTPTRSPSGSSIIGAKTNTTAASDVPDTLDWREEGAVTPIKAQGKCGCCWAFSAVAAIEGLNQIKNGNLVSLSEQQIVDCDVDGNDNGCNGGLPDGAFQYVKTNGGLVTEQSYRYTATQGPCNSNAFSVAVTISGYQDVPSNSESALLQAVALQPISVGIDAGDPNFKSYGTGVYTGPCGQDLHHAVTLVGYGADTDGTKYWLVKNQWGTTWGEDGYMRILRDTDDPRGLCGIAMHPSYPIA